MEDVATGKSVSLFEVFRRDDLAIFNQFRQIWRLLRQRFHHGIAERIPLTVPIT